MGTRSCLRWRRWATAPCRSSSRVRATEHGPPRSASRWRRCSPPSTHRRESPLVVGHPPPEPWLGCPSARVRRRWLNLLHRRLPVLRRATLLRRLRDQRTAFCPSPAGGPFEGPDSADLDEDTKCRIAAAAIGVPAGVTKGVVHLTDERGLTTPPGSSSAPNSPPPRPGSGSAPVHVPELAMARHLEFADLDSGHWPMFTEPDELARLLADMSAQD